METKKDYSKLEAHERIKAVKETFGEFEDFLVKASPKCQISFSDFEKALLGNYPTLKDICLTYGNDATAKWLLPQVVDLGEFADANNMTKSQFIELASVIARECQDLKISEVLNFFYQMKSAQLPITNELSPLSVIVNLRNFLYKCKDMLWNMKKWKVYMIVEDQPKTKVYARVFLTKESAEKALEERDERTGERLYPACHVIERIVE
jgi:hypothetical protein